MSTNCKFLIIYFCFLDIDDCDPLPCENGATCTNAGVNNYTCTCMAGYEGYNCSIGNLDHLFSIPPISREESYIVLSLILILPLTRHPMIYNDVRMWSESSRKTSCVLHEKARFRVKNFAMFNIYLYFPISIFFEYYWTWMASLKEEIKWL